MSIPKQERCPSNLWLAIRDLYRWRKGINTGYTHNIFERLERNDDVEYISMTFPYQYMAWEMWKRHGNEDTFFALNNLEPDDY